MRCGVPSARPLRLDALAARRPPYGAGVLPCLYVNASERKGITSMPTLTITSVSDSGRETRYRLERSAIREAMGATVPAWIAQRGREGTVHSLETCDACRARAFIRERRGAEWQVMDAATAKAESMVAAREAREHDTAYPYTRTEHTEAVKRQIARFLRIARHCPERRLPETHKALRRMQAELREAATQHQQMLAIVCSVAADIAWSRWIDARNGVKVARHAPSERGTIGRTAIAESDLFQCPECDAIGAHELP